MRGRTFLMAALMVFLIQFASYAVLDLVVIGDERCGSGCWISATILGPIILLWLAGTAALAGAAAGFKAAEAGEGASGVAIGALAFVGIATLGAGLPEADMVVRAIAVGTLVDLAIVYAGYAVGRWNRPAPLPPPEP